MVLAVIAAVVIAHRGREVELSIVLPQPPITPPPRGVQIGEPIEYVAAASDAPVIAVGSARHLWISRDDGKTFARALDDGDAEIYGISVEPSGRVYGMWGEHKVWKSPGGRGGVDTIEFAFGIAEPDGRERWRPVNERIAAPFDTRAGDIVGEGAPIIGHDAGESWTTPASARSWHIWRAALDDHRTPRFFATRRSAPDSCEDCGRGFALLVGKQLTPVWTMLDHTDLYTDDFPYSHLACMGFGGSNLYVVTHDHLIAVAGTGKVIEREAIPAIETCTIAGNDRATYMAAGSSVIRIDTGEQRVAPSSALTPRATDERDELAVDQHGALLYRADACIWRYTESGAGPGDPIVCGPHR